MNKKKEKKNTVGEHVHNTTSVKTLRKKRVHTQTVV